MALNGSVRNIDQQLEELKQLQKLERLKKYKEVETKKELIKIENRINEYLSSVFSEYLETLGSQSNFFFYNKSTKSKLLNNCIIQFNKKYQENVANYFEKNYYKILKSEIKKQELHEQSVFLEEGENLLLQQEEVQENKKINWNLNGLQLGLTVLATIMFFPIGILLLFIFSVCKNAK